MSTDTTLRAALDAQAERSDFSGVVRVDREGEPPLLAAYGFADRAERIPNTPETRFGLASGAKAFTALVVMRLVEQGRLGLETTARSLLGDDLPLVADDVTIEHLLAHRSGIGDYLDEEVIADINDVVLAVPPRELTSTARYLPMLDGHPTRFAAGERFAYNNGGYVLLAVLAERASGESFPDLVRTLVCEPAGLSDTGFLRSDELPARTAKGYLEADGLRTNVFVLPVLGSGDGGIYSTIGDVAALWAALLAGRIVAPDLVREMLLPRSDQPDGRRYGLGFHLAGRGDVVLLRGADAGVSFASDHHPTSGLTWTVISNVTDGAWPVADWLSEGLGAQRS